MFAAMRDAPGHRRGENHPRAVLTDAQVCELRDLREHRGLTYAQLVELFAGRGIAVGIDGVKLICQYRRRAGVALYHG